MSASRGSILFNRFRQVAGRNKSTFVYEADKTMAQRWVEKNVKKQQNLQKMYAAEDGIPIWWKTTGDKFLVTLVFAGTVASFGVTCVNLFRYARGQL
ncbi:hypothetical protein BpHYR1_011654 [Brachionus plicatilis]|uniref:Uncharacterized protein n=1 Tax=Brachionus plicatilis TaxID=10195 RepID=A0A3M7S6N3_BRAPC|nr:hypothetical protein BpHYR1_011654 [Brachionus plicatilis]